MYRKVKVLAIHNFHRSGSASGDDQVFKSETKLLEEHGHEVIRYTISNDEFDQKGLFGKVMCAFGMLWSFKNYRRIKTIISEEKPDIVHIHTFFPILSPSILYAAKRQGCKVIVTLHDTRFVCPCATSLRGTELCNKCGDGHYLRMVKYGCFKNSRIQSFIVACIFKYHRMRKTFYKQIDRYICLNDNQIKLLTEVGFDKSKITKKYNFVPDVEACIISQELNISEDYPEMPGRYVVFYGRIGEEKGVHLLMKLWSDIHDIPLVVMGGGPLEEEFSVWAEEQDNVLFLGYTEHSKCLKIVRNAEFVLVPSICYEGCSMVEIETESLGVPLIATDLGFSVEAITGNYNGIKVPLGDVTGFRKAVYMLWNSPEECKRMGENARQDYEKKYMPEDNYNQLIEIYSRI